MEREKWIALCTRTIGKLISPDGDVKFLVPDASLLKLPEFHTPQQLDDTAFHNYQGHNLAGGYSLEHKLLSAVKKGNYSQAEDLAHKYVNFQLKYRSKDHITPSLIGIELNALLRNAAHEAGVYSLRLEEVFTKYCRLLGKNHSDIPHATMIRDYCNLVAQYANRHQSPIIRSCVDYIDFFYSNPITLRELAQQNAITEQYLATLFRKELNMTFVEYLNETRISHAKIMLQNKDMSVQEISARCGFNDSSYFSRTFKKVTGMSPMLYRSSMLMESSRSSKG